MDIFKNSKDIAELVALFKTLIDAHNTLYKAHNNLIEHVEELTISHNSLQQQVEELTISHNSLQQQVQHLNKELGIETHIHDGARDPS